MGKSADDWLWAYVDILLVTVFALSAYALLALSSINPRTDQNTVTVSPPGSVAVAIAWPEGPGDVDLWVTGPGQDKATGYSNRSGKLFSLLRDDRGIDGELSPVNMENAFARSTPAGEYIINVHGYSLPLGAVSVFVEVSYGASADAMKLLVATKLDLRQDQERTVVRFTLDNNGQVVPGSAHQVFKKLRSKGK